MNNSVGRGKYQIPGITKVFDDPDKNNQYYDEYIQELKEFSVIA